MNASIRNSIIYNVYPTSFFDSNGDGVGDLKGITQKLPYIKELADIVWINPIFKSPFKDGGYDVEDYYAIDERFGTMEDLGELLKEAHRLGLKVLLDLVVGHTSDQHPWFSESGKHERNEFSDYYIWNDDVFGACEYKHISGNCERNGNYLINFFCFQPSLNFGFSEKKYDWQYHYLDPVCLRVHDVVIDIIKFYMAMGVDGFRVDMADSIVKEDDAQGTYSCEVWRKIFGKVREEYPQAIFVAEWGQPKYAVSAGNYDVDFFTHCHNKGYNGLFRKEAGTNVLKSQGHSFFRREGLGEAATFLNYFLENLKATEGKGYTSVVTGNHDLPRVSMGRDFEELKAVFAFVLALPCVPLIYYGDEIGMPYSDLPSKDGGYCRTGSRTPMQWTDEPNAGFSEGKGELYLPVHKNYVQVNVQAQQNREGSLLRTVQELVAVKRAYPELFSCGNSFELISDTYPLVISRKAKMSRLICMINPSEREYEMDIEPGQVLSAANAQVMDGKVKLGPVSYLWFRCNYSE